MAPGLQLLLRQDSPRISTVIVIVIVVVVGGVCASALAACLLRLVLARRRALDVASRSARSSSSASDMSSAASLHHHRQRHRQHRRAPAGAAAAAVGGGAGGGQFPLQAPGMVRILRHVQSSGVSVGELDLVAPQVDFDPQHGRLVVQPDERQNAEEEGAEEEEEREEEEDNDAANDDYMCPVCLDDLSPDIKVRYLPCSHVFHAHCIEEWATKANRCPVCNTHIIEQDDLQKMRTAVMQGLPLSLPETMRPQQRRRRQRGHGGLFELQDQPPPLSEQQQQQR